MVKAALLDAWPLGVALMLTCAAIWGLVRVARESKVQSPRSKVVGHWTLDLHFDERGSVQSLSFVLTVPLFIMLMLLAVQITQLMIGQIMVHYAAFAAARSAVVWIPARIGTDDTDVMLQGENRIGVDRKLLRTEVGGESYQITPVGWKFEKIHRAAALACVSVAPSRNLGIADSGDMTSQALVAVFSAYSPTAQTNSRLPVRLANKWAYSFRATQVELSAFHRRHGGPRSSYQNEPPLWHSDKANSDSYYKPTEIGWQDEITVKVTHNFALLPGPGRLLSRRSNESQRTDRVSRSISQAGGVYYVPISASATLVPEGEKSVVPYVHQAF